MFTFAPSHRSDNSVDIRIDQIDVGCLCSTLRVYCGVQDDEEK